MACEKSIAPYDRVRRALVESGLLVGVDCAMHCLASDGSERCFVRIVPRQERSLIAVLPNERHPKGRAEARAAHRIGKHLFAAGVAVPEIFAFDGRSGILFMEDMGALLLHDHVRAQNAASHALPWYRRAVEALVCLQIKGGPGFSPSFCWETACYDKELMLARESGYFYEALCRNFLGLAEAGPELNQEFHALADRAAEEPAGFVLHRDFQSRNLMIHGDRIRIIDFQGARLGPLAYDLASLLIDPYAGLTTARQEELLGYYLDVAARHIPLDRARFIEGYYYMALQRNLQILGAFAFLWRQKGKVFFQDYLRPAAQSLHAHLLKAQGAQFPCLRNLSEQVLVALAQRPE